MKCTIILALVAGVFAIPQASITSAPTVRAPTPSGLTPQVSCALACNAGDVNCQAACLGNARPNASQAIDTNNCAAKCDQGDGSAAAATAFAKCVDGCINSLFPSSQTAFGPGAAQGASVGPGASATGSVNPTAPSGSRPSGSSSGTAANSQQTGAAGAVSARLAGAGLAGFLAIFAL